ncbi:hypothetical protein JI57_01830 [Psychromonas sp. PRT-SC03]|nr:hypothetical protein JI57_01830 [Psychromonas sp. PRT-SC03]
MVFSLFSSKSAGSQYFLLIIGPLVFSLLSWLWFSIWRHMALRDALSAIYMALSDYIYLRQCALLGDADIKSKLDKKIFIS